MDHLPMCPSKLGYFMDLCAITFSWERCLMNPGITEFFKLAVLSPTWQFFPTAT
uniref:Uncharacterized protein n=1 Tax=Anguilla anguilla TaxID=7936 RepID=A0A0E9WGH9_ANGAN